MKEVATLLRSTTLAIIGLAAASLLLTGCTSSEAGGVTLADTKSATQLLRNEASSRLAPGAIDEITDEEDHSVGCKEEGDDPDGLWRSWQSSLLATIATDSAWRVEQLAASVSDSFIDDGWYVSGSKDGKDRTVITKPGSVATIAFTITEGAEDGTGATVHIDATGPCVLTAGPDSDEVTKLEVKK